MDSDTKVSLLSNSPSETPEDWFIPQEQVFLTREKVNKEAGSRRMLAHFTFTPGWPGWLDKVDEAVERFKPDSWKGYTVGDNTHKESAQHPWHADDEKLMYVLRKGGEGGHQEHLHPQGALCPQTRRNSRGCLMPTSGTSARRRNGRSSISSSTTRLSLGRRQPGRRDGRVRQTGAVMDQRSRRDPGEYGVTTSTAISASCSPGPRSPSRASPHADGMLVKGSAPTASCWGTRAWTGAPQWQIEGLRRLEILRHAEEIRVQPLASRRPGSRPRSSAATPRGSTGWRRRPN